MDTVTGVKRRLQYYNYEEESDKNSEELITKKARMDICSENTSSFPSPMDIDLVLLEIFSYLKLSDLKRCREICTLWNKIGIQVLQSNNNAKVVFKPAPKIEGQRNQNRLQNIQEFTTAMSLSPPNPYCNYEFHKVSFRNLAVKSFFKQFGSGVKSLTFAKKSGYSSNQYLDLRIFSNMLAEMAPNLEKLDLQELPRTVFESDSFDFPANYANRELSFPKLKTLVLPEHARQNRSIFTPCKLGGMWVQMLKASPKLNEIVSNIKYPCGVTSMVYHEQLLKALTDTNRLGGLTRLRLKNIEGSNLIQLHSAATTLGMSLVEFHVGTVNENTHPRSMQQFLQTQRKSLKALTIGNFEDGASLLLIHFPEMESLKSLNLSIFPGLALKSIENDVLTAAFPVLDSLQIHSNRLKDLFNSLTPNIHPGVTHLNIELLFLVPLDIHTLAYIFPNIKTVKLASPKLDVTLLVSIWLAWPNLIEIELCHKGKTFLRASRDELRRCIHNPNEVPHLIVQATWH